MAKVTIDDDALFIFVVIDAICHNGIDYRAGDTIELTKKQAEPLLKMAVLAKA